jgi:hypothetical protein
MGTGAGDGPFFMVRSPPIAFVLIKHVGLKNESVVRF